MARSVSWRRISPECVGLRAEQSLRATIYILHQTGPTGFVLKEEGSRRKLKVFLGDPHTCSCSVFKKEKELCIHILWVLLKKFRVPRENPVSFQLGLVEREISEVLHGYVRQQNTITDQRRSTGSHATPKEIGPDDVCPICQEELLGRGQALTYCKLSCGNSVHVKCMKIWAEHQKSNGEKTVSCPLCREDFGALERSGHPWRPAKRTNIPLTHATPNSPRTATLSPSLIESLQARSLTENDYGLLLQLDSRTASHNPSSEARASQGLPARIINSFHVEPVDSSSGLLQNEGAVCEICLRAYRRGDWIRTLPCDHKFHRNCIDQWLHSGHTSCPVDGRSLWPRRRKKQPRKPLLSRRAHPNGCSPSSWATRRIVGPLTHAVSRAGTGGRGCEEEGRVEFTLSGQSIGVSNKAEHEHSASLRSLASRRSSISVPKAPAGISKDGSSSSRHKHGLFPKIPTSKPSMAEVCSRRNVMENTRRMLIRRKSLSPTGERENEANSPRSMADRGSRLPLEPTCSGYNHSVSTGGDRTAAVEALPPLHGVASSSSPPLQGRLRKGSMVTGASRSRSHTVTDSDMAVELDSSLCVSSFKLCPLSTTSSITVASSQL